MRFLSFFCLSAALLATNISANAQGSSDPGLGSVGAMRPASALSFNDGEEHEYQRTHIGLGVAFAKGEREIRVPYQDYGYFDVRLPINAIRGELGNVYGLGDLAFSYTHLFTSPYHEDWTIQVTGGGIFGMTTANQEDGKTRPLPMAYQSSMGSTDVIAAANFKYKEYLTVGLGFQQPVFRYNENEYDRTNKVNDLVYNNPDYQVARKLYRQGDMMLRIEGTLATDRVGISGSPLLIYHLANDLYTDRNGLLRELKGSQGLTLNGVANAFLRIGRRGQMKIDVTASLPIVKRDATPEGLSREWFILPRFTYFFNQKSLLFRNF
jgi:hypothetical protein